MKVLVAVSDKSDGDMSITSSDLKSSYKSQFEFLNRYAITVQQTTRINLSYETNNFCRYAIIDEGFKGLGMAPSSNIPAYDGLVVTRPNHALFLLLADCIGAVIFDPENQVMMLSHLGRHSLEQDGFIQSVEFLKTHFKSKPTRLKVWLSPAAGKDMYPIYNLEGKGLKEVIFEQIYKSGVMISNVKDNQSETTTDPNYFSHTMYINGQQDSDGRQVMIAMMFED